MNFNMMEFTEQKKEMLNGIPSSFFCHIQEISEPGIVYPAHFHRYIEILYGNSGEFDVYLSGKRQRFGEGDMILINSREVHQINSVSDGGGRYFVIRFEPEIIYNSMSQSLFELKYILPFILENATHAKYISRNETAGSFIPELFSEMIDEFQKQEYGYELAIKTDIGRLYLWILRYWYKSGTEPGNGFVTDLELMKRLQPAFDYVLEHYDRQMKASEMARLSGMSCSYFSRVFNQVMHMNFSSYVNYIRIAEAEKLLVSTDLNITEIAGNTGFSSTSYFIKQFQYYKNISPKQFRIAFK